MSYIVYFDVLATLTSFEYKLDISLPIPNIGVRTFRHRIFYNMAYSFNSTIRAIIDNIDHS